MATKDKLSFAAGVFALCLAVAATADAQRYLVVVGADGTRQLSIVEFRPCIPAEGSGCGAWVDRVIDASADSSYGTAPAVLQRQATPNARMVVAIHDGSVMITSLVRPDSGRSAPAHGLHGAATALAVSGDSEYAFVVTRGVAGGPAEVCMVDLEWKSVIARVRLTTRPAGIAVTR